MYRRRRRRSVKLVPNIVLCVPRIILLLLSLFSVKLSAAGAGAGAIQMAGANCPDICGNVTIPYPFGIGTGCFLDEWYEVVCLLQQRYRFVPRLKKIGVDVLDISLLQAGDANPNGWVRVNYPIFLSSPNCTDNGLLLQVGGRGPRVLPSLSGSNFFFSRDGNVFAAIGCNVHIAFMNVSNSAIAECKSECKEGSGNGSRFNDCSGNACCLNRIPSDMQAFSVRFQTVDSATPPGDGCSYAFLADWSWFKPSSIDLYSLRNLEFVPVKLGWGIGSDTTSRLMKYDDYARSFFCSITSGNHDRFPLWQCYCLNGYDGNPYLGCQDIDECGDPSLNICPEKCVNTKGLYSCDGGEDGGSRAIKLAMIVVGGFVGAVFFLLSARCLCRTTRKRRCLNLNGRMRPTMKEVAAELEALRRPLRQSPPPDAQEIEDRPGNFEIDVIKA